jgi:hypothetical protein
VVVGRSPQELLKNAKMIDQAYLVDKKTKKDPRFCCALAERRSCVCSISFTCPVHGSTCIGTHD